MLYRVSQTLERKNNVRNLEYLPMKPNTLWDNPGARRKSFRVGRGNGSGKGKTCGRGMNGQKSRPGTGKISPQFIGGQNPLNKRLPKKGFNNRGFKKPYETINIDKLIYFIRKERLDPSKPITMKDLFDCGAFRNIKYGVKVLGRGSDLLKENPIALNLEVSDASQSAIDAIKEAGGSVTSVYHTETTLKRLIKPFKFVLPEAKIPMPSQKKVLQFEKMKEKGMEVRHPPAPWYEEFKAQQEKEREEFDARKKTRGEELLPQYPADRSPGVSLNKPIYEKEEISRQVKYPIP